MTRPSRGTLGRKGHPPHPTAFRLRTSLLIAPCQPVPARASTPRNSAPRTRAHSLTNPSKHRVEYSQKSTSRYESCQQTWPGGKSVSQPDGSSLSIRAVSLVLLHPVAAGHPRGSLGLRHLGPPRRRIRASWLTRAYHGQSFVRKESKLQRNSRGAVRPLWKVRTHPVRRPHQPGPIRMHPADRI